VAAVKGLETTDATLCAVIPGLNEAERIEPVVRGALEHVDRVFVIDDGSTDQTAAVAREAGAEVLQHATNLGKGASLRDGLSRAFEEGCDLAITLDADGQHLPGELPRFLEAWGAGADLVVGTRMGDAATMPWLRRNTNLVMSWIVSRLAGAPIPDSQNGFRAITRRTWETLGPTLTTSGFDFESDILIQAGRRGLRIASVPVSTIYGDEQSRIRPCRDTIRFFSMVARKLVEPRPERIDGATDEPT
jgi:glycosyltransferase involved in cell wall biosynthesis